MNLCTKGLGLLIGLLMAFPAISRGQLAPDAGAKSFAEGTELLKKADFDGALKAYAEAARTDGDNAQFRQEYMLLRKIIKTRDAITKEANPDKWWQLAVTLRNYYYKYELYKEILPLARQMNEKKKSVESAVVLADAYLTLGQNAEAEKAVSGLDAKDLTPSARLVQGIALARQNKLEAAKAILGQVTMPEKPSPRFMLDLARLKVLCGDKDGGYAALTTAFESVPPGALDSFKAYAKKTPEFAAAADNEQLAKVFQTPSKVKESACSGGKDCGTCPSKGGSCPSGKGSPSCAQEQACPEKAK
jgi:hypothetical protein